MSNVAQIFRLPVAVTIEFGGTEYFLSDHGRSPITESTERVESTTRTARGTRRSYFIAQKREWSIEWVTLPATNENTVDGYMGLNELVNMYNTATGQCTMKFMNNTGMYDNYNVNLVNFEFTLNYRYKDDFWYDCSLSIEEV